MFARSLGISLLVVVTLVAALIMAFVGGFIAIILFGEGSAPVGSIPASLGTIGFVVWRFLKH